MRTAMQRGLAGIALISWLGSTAHGQLFFDDLDLVGSAANYTITRSSDDTAVTFGFDYSTLGIPPAPNSVPSDTTLGVKFEANLIDPAATEAITLHTRQSFSADYVVTFDAWINANGPFPAGGGGSTEFLTAGVGGDGQTPNLGAATGVGGFTAVSGEGGSSRDYRMYKGADEQFAESGQFAAGTSSAGGGAHNSSHEYYVQFGAVDVSVFDQGEAQTGTTGGGTFGFAWHEVQLVVDSNGGSGQAASMAWFIDGLLIGKLDAGSGQAFPSNGAVTVGYMDVFTSVSDNAAVSFGLVDNLKVTSLVTGDVDGDGVVDMNDYDILRDNLYTGAGRTQGDLNNDGAVNLDDFAILKAGFAPPVGVPEPSAVVLAVLGAGLLLVRRRGAAAA